MTLKGDRLCRAPWQDYSTTGARFWSGFGIAEARQFAGGKAVRQFADAFSIKTLFNAVIAEYGLERWFCHKLRASGKAKKMGA
jgi:hypothetical protein